MTVKVGHKCCGCFCDVRRAVIILNGINFYILLIGLIVVVVQQAKGISTNTRPIRIADSSSNMEWNTMIIISILFMIISTIGIYGGMKLNIWMISLAATMYLIDFITGIINMNEQWDGVIIAILFLYPHLVLIREIQYDIMTYNNYRSQEEYSCCCVKKYITDPNDIDPNNMISSNSNMMSMYADKDDDVELSENNGRSLV